jgi:hypothetical protein
MQLESCIITTAVYSSGMQLIVNTTVYSSNRDM